MLIPASLAVAIAAAGTASALTLTAPEECAPAVSADPLAAREAAAHWYRQGGGVPARLCEAAALAALGAEASAAALLTRLGENPHRALSPAARAAILADAARLWLDAGEPALATAALDSAGRLVPPDRDALNLAARAAAAQGDWERARTILEGIVAEAPDDAAAGALLAAAMRLGGDPEAGLAAARAARAADPALPEARFEEAAALAETGARGAAVAAFLDLAADAPDHALAQPARDNARRLAGQE